VGLREEGQYHYGSRICQSLEDGQEISTLSALLSNHDNTKRTNIKVASTLNTASKTCGGSIVVIFEETLVRIENPEASDCSLATSKANYIDFT
jgi:hypothetical protein